MTFVKFSVVSTDTGESTWPTTFSYSGINKLVVRLRETYDSCSGNSAFWSVIFLLVGTIIGIWGKQFSNKEHNSASGQLIFWLMEIIFFHFLRHQWTVASGSTFPLNGTQFYELIFKWTTDFLASGNHFYCPFFWRFLPVIVFFPPSGNVLLKKIVHSG